MINNKYKISNKATGEILAVADNPTFVIFLSYGRVCQTNKQYAQGIVGNNGIIYKFSDSIEYDAEVVTYTEITEKEFMRLQSLINSGKLLDSPTVVAEVLNKKIADCSALCEQRIVNGFTVKLSDNKYYSFKLTVEDQINLMRHDASLRAGAKTFIYHATDMPCRIFSREDMRIILDTYQKFTNYHTTYFNAVKQYLKTLTSVAEINAFEYGSDISNVVPDRAIAGLLKRGGFN